MTVAARGRRDRTSLSLSAALAIEFLVALGFTLVGVAIAGRVSDQSPAAPAPV